MFIEIETKGQGMYFVNLDLVAKVIMSEDEDENTMMVNMYGVNGNGIVEFSLSVSGCNDLRDALFAKRAK